MESPENTSIASAIGLGRLLVVLVASVLGIAAFWHVLYGASLLATGIVVAEAGVLIALAFLYAWRSVR